MNLHRHARGIEMLQQIPPRLSTRIRVDREAAGRLVENGLTSSNGLLMETEAKSLITAYGIPVNPTVAAFSADEAAAIAHGYGFPVVMKILSRDIIHKSDAGGVVLNLKNIDEVKKTFADMVANARAAFPEAEIEGVTIQPMIRTPDCELILGVKKDLDFGPVILFGMGGVLAELLGDRAIALPPLNRLLAARLMEGTRIDRLLKGYRNHPPADRERLEEVLIRLAQLTTDFPQIAELDINPMVIQKGQPIAVDARVVLKPATVPAPMHWQAKPAIRPSTNRGYTWRTSVNC